MDLIPTVALIVVLGHLVLGVVLWLGVRKLYYLPGHWGFPVIGNLYYFYRTLLFVTLDSNIKYLISINEKYGKNGLCFHWIYGFKKAVVVTSPNIVKELAFHPNLSDKPNLYQGFAPYMTGPFTTILSDDKWKLQRKEYNNALKRSKLEGSYHNTFIKCANKMVDLMLRSHSAVDLHMVTLGVIQDVSMENMFGIETNVVYHPNLNSLVTKVDLLGSNAMANPTILNVLLSLLRLVDGIIWRKLGELRKLMLTGIDHNMKSIHCSEQENEFTLSMLIASRAKKEKQTEKQLLNELQEVFLISSHTVTATLVNSLIFLAVLPDIQERAWKEQYEIFGNDDREPTVDDLKQMLFLDRFIKESLRFCSPSIIGRSASGDIIVDGVTIPKGTTVLFLMGYMKMDPKYWKDPEVFDPDRFLEESDTLKYSYTPFGFGIRNCTGMYYATAEMKIILSKVLRRLKLTPVKKGIRFEELKFKICLMRELVNPPPIQLEERT